MGGTKLSFYLIQLSLFIIYSLLFCLLSPKFNRLYYVITGIHLIMIMGLRSFRVGTDTFDNIYSYNSSGSLSIKTGVPVYSLLSKIIYKLSGGNYHAFLFIIAALTVSIVFYCIYEMHLSKFESFLAIYFYITFYYYFDSFNIQRQMLAVSIAMLVPLYLLKRKNVKAIIFLLLAIGVHNTAIIAAIDFLICKVKQNKLTLCITSILTIAFIYFSSYFFNVFASISDHYEMYVGASGYSSKGGSILIGLLILLFVFMSLKRNSTMFSDKSATAVMYISCVAGLLYIIGGQSVLIIRMANYFGVFVPIFISMVPEIVSQQFGNSKLIRMGTTILILLVGIIVMYYKLSQNIDGIIPYSV